MQKVFDTNFFGLVRVTKAVLPSMKAKQSGRIVNISSIVAFDPIPFVSIYSASKFAVEGFTEALAAMLIEFNITYVKLRQYHLTVIVHSLFSYHQVRRLAVPNGQRVSLKASIAKPFTSLVAHGAGDYLRFL